LTIQKGKWEKEKGINITELYDLVLLLYQNLQKASAKDGITKVSQHCLFSKEHVKKFKEQAALQTMQ
jgi:hypothetical protein